MAISLGFGVMFATFITLLLIPCFYMTLEDIKGVLGVSDRADANAPMSTDSATSMAADPGE